MSADSQFQSLSSNTQRWIIDNRNILRQYIDPSPKPTMRDYTLNYLKGGAIANGTRSRNHQ